MRRETVIWTCDLCGKHLPNGPHSIGMSNVDFGDAVILTGRIAAMISDPNTDTNTTADLCDKCAVRVGEKIIAELKARRK